VRICSPINVSSTKPQAQIVNQTTCFTPAWRFDNSRTNTTASKAQSVTTVITNGSRSAGTAPPDDLKKLRATPVANPSVHKGNAMMIDQRFVCASLARLGISSPTCVGCRVLNRRCWMRYITPDTNPMAVPAMPKTSTVACSISQPCLARAVVTSVLGA
jgi:hypothetical protein